MMGFIAKNQSNVFMLPMIYLLYAFATSEWIPDHTFEIANRSCMSCNRQRVLYKFAYVCHCASITNVFAKTGKR